MTNPGDGGLDFEIKPGYLPTASPSEQSTATGKPKAIKFISTRIIACKKICFAEKTLNKTLL